MAYVGTGPGERAEMIATRVANESAQVTVANVGDPIAIMYAGEGADDYVQHSLNGNSQTIGTAASKDDGLGNISSTTIDQSTTLISKSIESALGVIRVKEGEVITGALSTESIVNNLTDTVELGLNPDIAVGSIFKTTNIADPEYYSQVLQHKDFTELRAKKADNTTYHEINSDASVISCFDVDNTITEISNIETLSINKSVDISGITAVTVTGNIEPDFPTNPAILGEQTTITYGANVVTHRLAAEPAGSAISRVQDADFSCVITQNSNQFNLQNSGANQVQILGEVEAGQVIVSASDNDVNSSQVTTAIGSVEVFSTDGTSTTIVVTNAESHEANAVSGDKTVTLSLDPTDNYSGTGFYVNDAVTGNAGIGMYSDSITSTVATPAVDSRVKIEPGLVDIRNTVADGSSTIMQSEVGNIAWTLTDVPNTKSTTFGATPERFDIGSGIVEFVSIDGANNATTSQNSGEVAQSITNGTNSTSSSFMPGEYTLSATDGSVNSNIGVTLAGVTHNVSQGTDVSSFNQTPTGIELTSLGITRSIDVADNATTTVLSASDLNTAYPSAIRGFKVYCLDIVAGALIYEKSATGWISTEVTIVP
jgi:hypothetical protein